MKKQNHPDLEERLINFSVGIIELSKKMDYSIAGRHLANQIVRSGTSPALNYGEAKSAESRKDFIHKMKIALKELRETKIALLMISRTGLYTGNIDLNHHIKENGELIAIFIASIITSQRKLRNGN